MENTQQVVGFDCAGIERLYGTRYQLCSAHSKQLQLNFR